VAQSTQTLSIGLAALLLSTLANAQSPVTVKDLNPFTHVAMIPAASELSSIKLERVKLVKIPTKLRLVMNSSCDEQAFRDPGGSMYCPSTRREGMAQAYEVTYSYRGQPMASDGDAGKRFTFSVYYRPEELSSAVRALISRDKALRGDVAGFFEVHTSGDPQRRAVIDEANSKVCAGSYVDGSWIQAESGCKDDVKSKTVDMAAEYVTVRVEPSSTRVNASR
jgi:hypothetical protein